MHRGLPRGPVLLAGLAILLAGCGLWRGEADETALEAETPAGPVLRYTVSFEGPLDDELRRALVAQSQAASLADRPPASELLLERRAADDVGRLEAGLRSLGYYDGRVRYVLERPGDTGSTPGPGLGGLAADDRPVRLVFTVEPGPRYRFGALAVEAEGAAADYRPPTPAELGLVGGEPATAQKVIDADAELLRRARKAGHPLARAGQRRAVVDHGSRTMDVTLRIAPGPVATLGEITFEGAEGIDPRFLRRRLRIRPGSPYDPDALEEAREDLIDSNLFSTVRPVEATALDGEGRLPVAFEVTQRKHRSIGAGVGYRTDEGPNTNLFWESRNWLGGGERLRFELELSPIRQAALASFRNPEFLARGQNLLVDGSTKHEDTDAFTTTSVGAGIGLERYFTRKLIGTLGLAYRYADIEEPDEATTVGLASIPATLDWDFTDNRLDATRGGLLLVQVAPFVDTLEPTHRFLKARATHSRYVTLLAERRLVLAVRGSLGSIVGVARNEVPADERFYAGGGGSIRGIGFQLAGPLDDDDKPLGGKSILELNGELRLRVTETIGAVAFLDAGTVYEESYPDFSEALRFGAGIGLRYLTPVGPLRLDVGVPLSRRADVDDPFQIYISIGQAF